MPDEYVVETLVGVGRRPGSPDRIALPLVVITAPRPRVMLHLESAQHLAANIADAMEAAAADAERAQAVYDAGGTDQDAAVAAAGDAEPKVILP